MPLRQINPSFIGNQIMVRRKIQLFENTIKAWHENRLDPETLLAIKEFPDNMEMLTEESFVAEDSKKIKNHARAQMLTFQKFQQFSQNVSIKDSQTSVQFLIDLIPDTTQKQLTQKGNRLMIMDKEQELEKEIEGKGKEEISFLDNAFLVQTY